MENKTIIGYISPPFQEDTFTNSRSILSVDAIQKIYEFDGMQNIGTLLTGKLLFSRYKGKTA